jgi:RNA polymerase sigma factor (sigma-70 family)
VDTTISDTELLKAYATSRSDGAFAELVHRHLDWIYSAALRRVGDPHLAEDVTQATFIVLSERAGSLAGQRVLAAWLFHVMSRLSAKALRLEVRQKRLLERAAEAAMHESSRHIVETDYAESELRSRLETAVERLRESDRHAILLRFYQQKSVAEVAAVLQITPDAAAKRIARATEKLRWLLGGDRSGYTVSSLGGMLVAKTVAPAPPLLAAAVMQPASAAGNATALARSLHAAAISTSAVAIAAAVGCLACFGIGTAWWMMSSRTTVAQLSTTLTLPSSNTTLPIPLADALPATRPAAISLEELTARIRATESQFKNVYVRNFRTTVETIAAGATNWQPNPRAFEGSAWYGEEAGGKTRIFFSSIVERWYNGRAPYLNSRIDLAWDGVRAVRLIISTERNGVVTPRTLLPSIPSR